MAAERRSRFQVCAAAAVERMDGVRVGVWTEITDRRASMQITGKISIPVSSLITATICNMHNLSTSLSVRGSHT